MFWSADFWSAGFWSEGFWEGQGSEPVPVPVPVRIVEIDFNARRKHRTSAYEISPKVRKLIKRIARKAVETPTEEVDPVEQVQEAVQELQEAPQSNYWADYLASVLSDEKIAWDAFYADLLQQQINAQITAQIRRMFEALGVYQQIEDDEQAIIMLMMEL